MKRRRSRRQSVPGAKQVRELAGEVGDAVVLADEATAAAKSVARRTGLSGDGYIGKAVAQLTASANDAVNLAVEYPITATVGTLLAYQTASGLLEPSSRRELVRQDNKAEFTNVGMLKLSELLRQHASDQSQCKTCLIRFFKCIHTHPDDVYFTRQKMIELDNLVRPYNIYLLTPEQRTENSSYLGSVNDRVGNYFVSQFGAIAPFAKVKAAAARWKKESQSQWRKLFVSQRPPPVDASAGVVDDTDRLDRELDLHAKLFQRYFPWESAGQEHSL